jgi:hypothetical protein
MKGRSPSATCQSSATACAQRTYRSCFNGQDPHASLSTLMPQDPQSDVSRVESKHSRHTPLQLRTAYSCTAVPLYSGTRTYRTTVARATTAVQPHSRIHVRSDVYIRNRLFRHIKNTFYQQVLKLGAAEESTICDCAVDWRARFHFNTKGFYFAILSGGGGCHPGGSGLWNPRCFHQAYSSCFPRR